MYYFLIKYLKTLGQILYIKKLWIYYSKRIHFTKKLVHGIINLGCIMFKKQYMLNAEKIKASK